MNDNPATNQAGAASEPSLQVRLVRNRGNAANAVLPVPTAGATLAAALELDGRELDYKQRVGADLCRIDRQGRFWQLSNDSHSIVCALNGARIPAGKSAPLANGDVLEVGLLRFVVELATVDSDVAPFDLRELASPSAHGRNSAREGADPFGALDIDGARPQPEADPLADLLGESPVAIRQTAAPAPMPPPLVTSTLGPRSTVGPADALFDDLHEGFVRAVRDPAQIAENAQWERSHAVTDNTELSTLEDMTRTAVEAYPLVRDMLQKPQTIGQILDGFDTLGRPLILDADEPDEVLRLFAPELAQGAKTPIPSLTRREHHALSPDSPMPADWGRPADKESE